jgi:DNA-binding MarR family transcriptional regulator
MDANEMRTEFFRVFHQLGRLKTKMSTELFGDTTRMEFGILMVLHEYQKLHPQGKGMYVSTLAGHLHTSLPAVSRTLKAMERKKLIRRDIDENDRRNTFIVLMELGEQTRLSIIHEMDLFSARVFERMGEEDAASLLLLWGRFVTSMETEFSTIQKGEEEC